MLSMSESKQICGIAKINAYFVVASDLTTWESSLEFSLVYYCIVVAARNEYIIMAIMYVR